MLSVKDTFYLIFLPYYVPVIDIAVSEMCLFLLLSFTLNVHFTVMVHADSNATFSFSITLIAFLILISPMWIAAL